MHEASQHPANCFLTLTYAELPDNGSLNYTHFQNFMKYLRKWHHETHSKPDKPAQPLKFYMCGEYGEKLNRPHYHAAIFGLDFSEDRYYWRTSPSGHRCYRSPSLERLWTLGNCELGELTAQSAGYIARYVMKKQYGKTADEHYQRTDPETGEVYRLEPEFNKMSNRPGIGASWFAKYHMDVFPHDHVIVNGTKQLPPRYYVKLLGDLDPAGADANQHKRMVKSKALQPDNSYARQDVKAQVLAARLSQLKRTL